MRCKVRFVSRQPNGSVAQKEQTVAVDGRRIKIGRGTDNDVFLKDLRVNYRHADIVVRDEDVIIEAVGDSALRIDGVKLGRGALTPETEIEAGPYRLRLLAPAEVPGADIGVEVELVAPPPAATVAQLVAPGGMRLQDTFLSRRSLSWGLFALALVVSLGLPLLAYFGKPEPDPGQVRVTQGSRPTLVSLDRLWNPGELSGSHKFLIGRCEACHEAAFAWVRSESCASCHATVQHHFDTARFQFSGMDATGCTGCHGEHQGPTGAVPTQQALCTDCHQNLDGHPGKTDLLNVADFGTDHPQLKVSVIVDPADGRVQRAQLPARGAAPDPAFPAERSGLKFPHAVHMAKACEKPTSLDPAVLASWPEEKTDACTVLDQVVSRMKKPAGSTMECGDCHETDPSGVSMRPATMEKNCADCHTLQFDNAAPERVLPHGQPDEVIAVVNDYFAARQAQGKPVVLKQDTGRRRPGASGAKAEQAAVVQAVAPRQQAQTVSTQRLDTLFGKSLCGYCHEVVPPAQSAQNKWEVKPVRVAEIWMPKSVFNHEAHVTSACTECHAGGETSQSATDVLMPPIETCRDCHGGEETVAEIPSTCTMCHVYHRDDLAPMLPRVAQAGVAAARDAATAGRVALTAEGSTVNVR